MEKLDLLDRLFGAIRISKSDLLSFLVVFSRFEYALKRAGFLKKTKYADPDWEVFLKLFGMHVVGNEQKLLDVGSPHLMRPAKQQKLTSDKKSFSFECYSYSELQPIKIIQSVKMTRNNLFHGGKFATGPYEDPTEETTERNQSLIVSGTMVLIELVSICREIKSLDERFGLVAEYFEY